MKSFIEKLEIEDIARHSVEQPAHSITYKVIKTVSIVLIWMCIVRTSTSHPTPECT